MSIRVFFSLITVLFLLIGCAPKEITLPKAYLQLEREGLENLALKGKLFLEGELFFIENKEQAGGAYGTFYLTKDEFLITLRPPLSSEIILYWQRTFPKITLINPAKKVAYLINFKNINLEDLPYYFLGLKEKEATWKKKGFEGEYRFFKENSEGRIQANLFNISWKIKELEVTEEKISPPLTEGYKVKAIKLTF